MTYLQLTGYDGNVMEVIDDSGQSRLCKKDESKYPLHVYYATATYTNGSILACGGYDISRIDQCYIFEKNQGWKELSKMNQARSSSPSIPIDGGIIVTGGYADGFGTLKSSQIVFSDGSAITEGPELPEPRYGHCMAYDKENDVFFVTGGRIHKDYGAQSTVWKFNDPEKFVLTGTSQMLNTRWRHACGIFRSDTHNKRPLLVAAGDYDDGDSWYMTSSCEFYDYTKANSRWQLCSKSKQFILCIPKIIQMTLLYFITR